jgi:3-oxoacyl-[acyl-carrier protein] reductase
MNLNGKTVVVTGAGRGIGFETALSFARLGANVGLAARSSRPIQELSDQISSMGVGACALSTDVGDPESVASMVDRVNKNIGPVNVLVNAAGAAIMSPIESLTANDWRSMVRANLDGVFYASKAVWGNMVDQGGGIIVNISSMAAIDPFPTFGAYASTKAAVNMLTRSLAEEGNPSDIRLFSVCPGAVETEMFRSLGVDLPDDQILHPKEVADFIVELTDDRHRPLSGRSFMVRKSDKLPRDPAQCLADQGGASYGR